MTGSRAAPKLKRSAGRSRTAGRDSISACDAGCRLARLVRLLPAAAPVKGESEFLSGAAAQVTVENSYTVQ